MTTAADKGIASSAAHAERVKPGWLDEAVDKVIEYATVAVRAGDVWTMEQARGWAYDNGLSNPPEQRAWGAVTRRLIRGGLIEQTGYAPAKSSNGSPKPTYLAISP